MVSALLHGRRRADGQNVAGNRTYNRELNSIMLYSRTRSLKSIRARQYGGVFCASSSNTTPARETKSVVLSSAMAHPITFISGFVAGILELDVTKGEELCLRSINPSCAEFSSSRELCGALPLTLCS